MIDETPLTLSRSNHHLMLDALVVDDLDVNVLAGTPFLIANDITVRPAKCQIRIRDSETIVYTSSEARNSQSDVVRRAHSYVLQSTSPASVVWPGEYLELDVPPDLGEDRAIAIEPHIPSSWPPPQILDTVGNKVRRINSTDEPKAIRRHEHLCHALPTDSTPSNCPPPPCTTPPTPLKPNQSKPFSSTVSLDPDRLLSTEKRHMFQQSLIDFDRVFDPKITGYNRAAGPIEATVNIGSVQLPQRKGGVPQYSRNQLAELQAHFDELEQAQVFRRPEDLNLTIEYLNLSFLVRKPSGGDRLVTTFADVARYSKPQPSLMPDVGTTLRTIAPWKYLIKTYLTRAFYQIPLSRSSMKYLWSSYSLS